MNLAMAGIAHELIADRPFNPGDRVRAGRVVGTVRRIVGDCADVQDDGSFLGRPTTWRIRLDALVKVASAQ